MLKFRLTAIRRIPRRRIFPGRERCFGALGSKPKRHGWRDHNGTDLCASLCLEWAWFGLALSVESAFRKTKSWLSGQFARRSGIGYSIRSLWPVIGKAGRVVRWWARPRIRRSAEVELGRRR